MVEGWELDWRCARLSWAEALLGQALGLEAGDRRADCRRAGRGGTYSTGCSVDAWLGQMTVPEGQGSPQISHTCSLQSVALGSESAPFPVVPSREVWSAKQAKAMVGQESGRLSRPPCGELDMVRSKWGRPLNLSLRPALRLLPQAPPAGSSRPLGVAFGSPSSCRRCPVTSGTWSRRPCSGPLAAHWMADLCSTTQSHQGR